MVDYSKPIKLSTGQSAKVLAVTNQGAWITWGLETVAFCFDQKGVAPGCITGNRRRRRVINVPEKREFYLITICGDDCRIEKL